MKCSSGIDVNGQASLSESEKRWIATLKSEPWNQSHLVDGADDIDGVKRLIAQIEGLNLSYPGGLLTYITRARKMLTESRNGINPFSGFIPSIPDGEILMTGSPEFAEAENVGLANVDKLAFVLVAGGLGERLGYPGIKIGLPIETCTGMSFIEYFIRMILACEQYAESRTGKRPKLPLAIMTSDDTHEKTEELLRSHRCFGLPEDQITLMKQQGVPALLDNEARMATRASDRFVIETKPHGHGDVHILINQFGLAKKWLSMGLEWMFLFQDTNTLVSHVLCPTLGVSVKNRFVMNSAAVPRTANENVGAICKLTKGSESLTVNVEYNQLGPLLMASGMGGDKPDPSTGLSPFPGNCNMLLIHLPEYSSILESTGGVVTEFVNPKYKDESKATFKSPTRLECLMQDLPRLFKPDFKVWGQ